MKFGVYNGQYRALAETAHDHELLVELKWKMEGRYALKNEKGNVKTGRKVNGWKDRVGTPCIVCGKSYKNMPSHVKKHRNNMEQPVN